MRSINLFLFEAKKKLSIYCDMDGVLTDMEQAVENLGYGTWDEINKKYGDVFIWKLLAKIGISFWSEMSWMKDGKLLWQFIKPYHPIILSAPSRHVTSRVGKKIWVQKNLGKNVKLILEASKNKNIHATSNSILIDDKKENIRDWKEAGGIGVLHKNAKTTIQKLKEILSEQFFS